MLWLIILVLVAVIIVGVIIAEQFYSLFGLFMWVISAIFLFILVLSCIILSVENTAELRHYKVVKESIEKSTEGSIENAAINIKKIESNTWLNEMKYWNSTMWSPLIPDEVDELEFIE